MFYDDSDTLFCANFPIQCLKHEKIYRICLFEENMIFQGNKWVLVTDVSARSLIYEADHNFSRDYFMSFSCHLEFTIIYPFFPSITDDRSMDLLCIAKCVRYMMS